MPSLYPLPRLAIALLVLLLGGCATYSRTFEPVAAQLAAGKPAEALKLVEARGGSLAERDYLLYLLDRAMLLHLTGDYHASNLAFEEAKRFIDDFDALSVSEQTGTLMINDATTTYTGSPLERVMLHLYAAYNYLLLGKLDAARVETLQVELRLRQLEQEEPEGALGVDPFGRYLSGLIFDALGEPGDALIAYRKAYHAYLDHQPLYPAAVPVALQHDLLRLTATVGLADEHRQLSESFAIDAGISRPDEWGEVVIMVGNGLVAGRRERRTTLPAPKSGQLVSVALPYYPLPEPPLSTVVASSGGWQQSGERVEQLDAINRAQLDQQLPLITSRAIARAVTKYNLTKEGKKQSDATGLLVNLAGVLTERADTRGWRTLPATLELVRLPLPPGPHQLRLHLYGSEPLPLTEVDLGTIELRPGERRFLAYHYIPPHYGRRRR